jgi:pyruvate dehydrogenase E2 component (dihydrolipoamide acetyltransferase)
MSVSVTMPRLGESVTEGTVTRWLKKEGERVDADEPLLEVSTDKVDTEIPSPAAGVVSQIKVSEDETVEVGAELAVIDDTEDGGGTATEAPAAEAPADEADTAETQPAETPPAEAQSQEAEPEQKAPQVPQQQPSAPSSAQPAQQPAQQPSPPAAQPPVQQPPSQPAPRQAAPQEPSTRAGDGQVGAPTGDTTAYVTPLVRKLAADHGVDLSTVSGTGVGGRIRKQDVLDAAERARAAARPAVGQAQVPTAARPSAAAEALRGRTEKLSRMRALIARRMVESLQISAQLTTVVEVDVTRIARLRQLSKARFEAQHGVKLSFLPFFALATVEALRQHPNVNASIDVEAGTVTYHDAEHLGMAVDTERGLMVPVIRDAGDLNLGGMARKIADLAARTRENKVGPDELGGGTFTLTNTGSRGALFDTPIINQPQVGILGTGTVVKRAVVVDDEDLGEIIVARSMMYLALSYDHRLVDGADAARFLGTVKTRLEGGAFEGELGLT